MQGLFKPNSTILSLFMFLPITSSIALITFLTVSVLNDSTTDFMSFSYHTKRGIDATGN